MYDVESLREGVPHELNGIIEYEPAQQISVLSLVRTRRELAELAHANKSRPGQDNQLPYNPDLVRLLGRWTKMVNVK